MNTFLFLLSTVNKQLKKNHKKEKKNDTIVPPLNFFHQILTKHLNYDQNLPDTLSFPDFVIPWVNSLTDKVSRFFTLLILQDIFF